MGRVVAAAVVLVALSAAAAVEEGSPLCSFRVTSLVALSLDVYPMLMNGKGLDFLDHRVSNGQNVLLVRSWADRTVYTSRDMGRSWRPLPNSAGRRWYKGFVTEEGNVLLWDEKQMELVDPKGNVLGTQPDTPRAWHGSWGIGQSGKTILWAEYGVAEATELRVFRSPDGGRTWGEAFRQRTNFSAAPQIRHFHVVQPDPYRPGCWYLASGDTPEQSKVWLSKDDGRTWAEVTDPAVMGTARQRLHRFTTVVFTKDYLYWATDDLMEGRKAAVVRTKRSEPLHLEMMGQVGSEAIRNLTATPYGLVAISEAKKGGAGVNVFLFTPEARVVPVGTIARAPGGPSQTGFTYSLGSKEAVEDTFFTYAEGTAIGVRSNALLWRLRPSGKAGADRPPPPG